MNLRNLKRKKRGRSIKVDQEGLKKKSAVERFFSYSHAFNCCNKNHFVAHRVVALFGSSLFLVDKMLFQFTRIGFCDDIHTKQRRAFFVDVTTWIVL
jgi:hypothetical protein